MPGVVLDINILVSSLIAGLGFPRQIFAAWRSGRYTLITSAGMIAELEEKLSLPRIARRFNATPELAQDTVTLLRNQATIVAVPAEERRVVTGDPEDDLVLATGRLAQANYLVTGDRKLLDLKQYEGMAIVTPREFAQILNLASH
jgi:putative PIN family toxin of toxin-antitoxin system